MGSRIIKHIKYLFEAVISVIYCKEESCIICKAYISDSNILICNECLNKIKFCSGKNKISTQDSNINCYSVSYYSKVMKGLILKLKYRSDFSAGEVIADLMTEHINREKIKFEIVTFVPMTKKSVKKRGYNQSEFLSKILSKNFKVPLVKCVKKICESNDQIGLDGNARWENLSKSFSAINSKMYFGKDVLLVDDVITTGATAYYCAEEIQKAGAKSVIVLTAAKSCI